MAAVVLCPACRGVVPVQEALRPRSFPFCSRRCQLSDLGHWLDGDYRLPEPIAPDDHEALRVVLEAREAEG